MELELAEGGGGGARRSEVLFVLGVCPSAKVSPLSQNRLTMLGAARLLILPIIDLRFSSFGVGLSSKVVVMGVFGLGGAVTRLGVSGTLLVVVEVR